MSLPPEIIARITGDKEYLAPGDDLVGYGPSLAERLRDSVQGDPLPGTRQTITVTNAVFGLIVPDFARSAFCTVTGARMRATMDGSVPTSTVGQRFDVGEHFTLTGHGTLLVVKFIQEAAGAIIDVDYFD